MALDGFGGEGMLQKALVLYDGECPFCVSSVQRLRRLDWLGKLEFGDARDGAILDRHPGIDAEVALRRLHLVPPGGAILEGFYAFRWLSRRLPALWLIWPFLWIPGVAPVGVRIYDLVARNRFAFGACDGDACDRTTAEPGLRR
jgi:predicted DCC family thiol-disulfide oxidoreductase YuxK